MHSFVTLQLMLTVFLFSLLAGPALVVASDSSGLCTNRSYVLSLFGTKSIPFMFNQTSDMRLIHFRASIVDGQVVEFEDHRLTWMETLEFDESEAEHEGFIKANRERIESMI